MTKQSSLKRTVRARMAKTGESYTAAREQVLAKADTPEPERVEAAKPDAAFTPPYSDEVLERRTGRTWPEWFTLIDDAGMVEAGHTAIARHLVEEHGVDGWWAQGVTVGYERARGLRTPGQRCDGSFTASASKTVNVPVGEAFAAFVDEQERQAWLPDLALAVRTATEPRTARFDVEDGSTRLEVYFTDKGPTKSMVAIQHSQLDDADHLELMKTWWRERLAQLKATLES